MILLILLSSYISQLDGDIRSLEREISSYSLTVHTQNEKLTMSATVYEANYLLTVCFLQDGQPLIIEDRYGKLSRGTTQGRDPSTGLTLIKTEKNFPVPAYADNPERGQLCLVYGNSFGNVGLVGMGYLQSPLGISFNLSIPLSPGNNGAGVFNAEGELMGVVGGRVNRTGFLSDMEGVMYSGNFAEIISIQYIKKAVKQIKEKGTVKRGWIGIVGRDSPGNMGVIIERVVDNSPAKKYGLAPHDLIIAVNGNNISGLERFKEITLSQSPGDTMDITLIRGRNRMEKQIILRERERGVDWESVAPDFKVEKITPKKFEESKTDEKEEILKQLIRLSREIELLRKKLRELE